MPRLLLDNRCTELEHIIFKSRHQDQLPFVSTGFIMQTVFGLRRSGRILAPAVSRSWLISSSSRSRRPVWATPFTNASRRSPRVNFPTCPSHNRQLPSAATESPAYVELAEELEFCNPRKWGWVIYRTAYGDDEAWEFFVQLVTRHSRYDLDFAKAPPILADTVEWTFVSDRATLDGASRDELRKRFVSWVAETEAAYEPREIPISVARHQLRPCRHINFVQVDEASLRSVVDTAPADDWDCGWVNLVRCAEGQDYNLDVKYKAELETYQKQLAQAGEEYITEDWVMLAAGDLSIGFYAALGSAPENWHMFYSQPPNLVLY